MERPAVNVGLCVIQIHLPGVASLKEKRQVLRSLKDRLRDRFNVAVAELDHQDLWQRATLGIVSIASARIPLEQTFASIEGEVAQRVPGEVLSCEVEYLS
ncbi:MAG TPA: DUF503 domain-containing protein [Candidatus Polarisedimenticolia bacterium]|nr:DUF503 domain-containing protein [Candidatus Polarisedimenticolia bacterium]